MTVWICAVFGIALNAAASSYGPDINPSRMPLVVIDNIESAADCQRVGAFLAGGTTSGSFRCASVRKVRS